MLPFFTCDVFTQSAYTGNPLAIVTQAEGLSTEAMQAIAREFNLSETIFVMPPHAAENTAKVRIFFPTAEIPFAGHPTIGCAIFLALQTAPEGDFSTEIRLEEVAGLVPVQVQRKNGIVEAELTAPIVPFPVAKAVLPAPDLAARALGLDSAQIGGNGHRIGVYEGGPTFLYVPVQDLAALAAARPSGAAWDEMTRQTGVDNAYLYAPGAGCDYQARMFAPAAGIFEDPATGSASAILAAQLLAEGALSDGETLLRLRQGYEMGRPSQIGLRVTVENGALRQVNISGSAVFLNEGRLRPPG